MTAKPSGDAVHASSLPLRGVRILELSHVIAGPYAGTLLADLGADVIKVEDPSRVDESRVTGPYYLAGNSLYYLALNWGKRSIAINLSMPAGRKLLFDIALSCDVVIDNYRPGFMAALGIDHEALLAQKPEIITCSLTGFGESGPYKERAGYDYTVQAMSGIMSLTGEPDAPPTKTGISYVDHSGGLAASLAICAALFDRKASGKGRHIDLSLHDIQISMLTYLAAWQLNAGIQPERQANSAHTYFTPAQNFRTADGFISLFIGTDAMWKRFATELGDPRLDQATYETTARRYEYRSELLPIIESIMDAIPTSEIVERLTRVRVPCSRVNTLAEALADPQVSARHMIGELKHPVYGSYKHVPGPLPTLSSPHRRAAPILGEDSIAVLMDIGCDQDRIARLLEEQIISLPATPERVESGDREHT